MEKTFSDINDLIGKYLAGEATAEEKTFVESWMDFNEANRKYFVQFKTIFDKAATVKGLQHFDTDVAWDKIKARLHKKHSAIEVKLYAESSSIKLFWRIAASIIIILGVGFFGYQLLITGTTKPIEVISENKTEADTLPDGSGVFLNRETKLAYSFDKRKKTHRVKLQGEAYFNINNHDKDKTFIVEVDGVLIKDVGTSFNVRGYPESNTIEVVVEEGEVMFYTENNAGIYLRAGGKGIYDKTAKMFAVEEAEPNVTAYKTRFFIFSDNDLAAVVQTLNEVYDQKILIDEALKNCRLTVTFNDESIEEIANIIAETLGLTIETSDQGIVLEGNGCEK